MAISRIIMPSSGNCRARGFLVLSPEVVHVSLLVYACLHDVLHAYIKFAHTSAAFQHISYDLATAAVPLRVISTVEVTHILGRTGMCAHVSHSSHISGSASV